MKKKTSKGFTLIELIVVMAIMAILVLVSTPRYLSYTRKTEIRRITVDVKSTNNKLAEYMMKNNDNLPSDSIVINALELQTIAASKRLYDINGLVEEVNEDDTFNILSNKYIKAAIGSKLSGQFIASSGGNVYYVSNNAITNDNEPVEPVEPGIAPIITLNTSIDPDKMIARIVYSANSTTQEYKIGNDEWQTAVITKSQSNNPFLLNANAVTEFIAEIDIPNGKEVYARSAFKNNETLESSRILNNTVLKSSKTILAPSIDITALYTDDSVIKEFRVGSGPWMEYQSDIQITSNTTIETRGINEAGNVVEYNLYYVGNILDISVFSKVFFVDATYGNDTTGNGELETPYKTFNKAYASITDNTNQAIYLGDGTYTVSVSDTKLKRMTIIGQGKSTTLHMNGPLRRITFSTGGASNGCMYEMSGLTISRLIFETTVRADNMLMCNNTTFNNVVFKTSTDPLESVIFSNIQAQAVRYNNCLDLTGKYGMTRTYGILTNCYGLFNIGASTNAANITRTTCINSAPNIDSDYNILISGWQNTGTGTNNDGTKANIGLYGGKYSW